MQGALFNAPRADRHNTIHKYSLCVTGTENGGCNRRYKKYSASERLPGVVDTHVEGCLRPPTVHYGDQSYCDHPWLATLNSSTNIYSNLRAKQDLYIHTVPLCVRESQDAIVAVPLPGRHHLSLTRNVHSTPTDECPNLSVIHTVVCQSNTEQLKSEEMSTICTKQNPSCLIWWLGTYWRTSSGGTNMANTLFDKSCEIDSCKLISQGEVF